MVWPYSPNIRVFSSIPNPDARRLPAWAVIILAQLVAPGLSPRQPFAMDLLGRRDFASSGASQQQIVAATVRAPGLGISCLHSNDFGARPEPGHPRGLHPTVATAASTLTRARPHRSRSRPAARSSGASSSSGPGAAGSSQLHVAAPTFGLQSLPFDESLPGDILLPQLAHRVQLAETVEACFAAAWAPSTRRTYSSALQSNAGRLEETLGTQLLPVDTDVKLKIIFAALDGKPWGTIQTQRTALRAWHLERSLLREFEATWSDLALHFWRGLKKRADHSHPRVKRPVDQPELIMFQRSRFGSGKLAGVRDAAAAAFCFYGIRRASEMLALLRSDVQLLPDCVEVTVRNQKNDPFGLGMRCRIPKLPALDVCCPAQLLGNWCSQWDNAWPHCSDGYLFCTTHAPQPKQMSGDSWRKALSSLLVGPAVGSHSLRKGGARWWKFVCHLPEEVVQAQGGWTTPDCMRAFYAKFSESERKGMVVVAAAHALPAGGPSASGVARAPLPAVPSIVSILRQPL